jgi:hypothetical protein
VPAAAPSRNVCKSRLIILQQLQDPQSFSAFRLEEMKNPFPLGVLT